MATEGFIRLSRRIRIRVKLALTSEVLDIEDTERGGEWSPTSTYTS